MNSSNAIEVAMLRTSSGFAGLMLSGRWPDSTDEWARVLLLAVRFAAVPGVLEASTVFRVREEVPEEPTPGAVGLVLAEGPVVGEGAVEPQQFAAPLPPGLLVLHPPEEQASIADSAVASGCVLLPGLPHLGLGHRAAWARSDRTGEHSTLRTGSEVEVARDVDTAVLAMLIAA